MTPEEDGDSPIKLRLLWSSNSLAVEDLIQILKVRPTRTWIKGAPVHPLAKNVRKENCLVIEITGSALSETASRLMGLLESSIGNLQVVHADIDVELSCIVTITSHAPELHLTAGQVLFFSSINAAFDIDVYVDEGG